MFGAIPPTSLSAGYGISLHYTLARDLTEYFIMQKFNFGFEEEDAVEGMTRLIINEVNTFRSMVRSQALTAAQSVGNYNGYPEI